MRYQYNKSWNDALNLCQEENAFLWSINSFSEWWHVSEILGRGVHVQGYNNAWNLDTIQILTSTLSFIGLIKSNEVSGNEIHTSA